MGTIIGCSSIHLLTNDAPINDNQQNTEKIKQGPTRLLQATTIKRNKGFTELVVKTWEQALNKESELLIKWIYNSEVLVGRTAQRT
jgi:hypothetical protein